MLAAQEASSQSIAQQHASILACCQDLLLALSQGEALGVVAQVRMRLSVLLHANLASEEAQVNGPLRRLPIIERPRGFTEMINEAADLRARYSEHVGLWTLRRIAADQDSYASATRELIARMTDHLCKKQALMPEWRRALTR